jgi:hypothetical protein
LHILIEHVPTLVYIYGGLKRFSLQSAEHNQAIQNNYLNEKSSRSGGKGNNGTTVENRKTKKILQSQLSYLIIDLVHLYYQIIKKEPIKIKKKNKHPTEKNKQDIETYNDKKYFFKTYFCQLSQWKEEENIIDWKENNEDYSKLIEYTGIFLEKYFLLSKINDSKFPVGVTITPNFQELSDSFFVLKNQTNNEPTYFSKISVSNKKEETPKRKKFFTPIKVLKYKTNKILSPLLQIIFHLEDLSTAFKKLKIENIYDESFESDIYLFLKNIANTNIYPKRLLEKFENCQSVSIFLDNFFNIDPQKNTIKDLFQEIFNISYLNNCSTCNSNDFINKFYFHDCCDSCQLFEKKYLTLPKILIINLQKREFVTQILLNTNEDLYSYELCSIYYRKSKKFLTILFLFIFLNKIEIFLFNFSFLFFKPEFMVDL